MTFYAYIYRRLDGTPFYVGKGQGRRYLSHLKRVNLNTKKPSHFYCTLKSLMKQGAGFQVEVLQCRDEQHAYEAERLLIAFYGRRDLGTGPLTNHTDGGEGAPGMRRKGQKRPPFTPEHRANISRATQRPWSAARREAYERVWAARHAERGTKKQQKYVSKYETL